MYLLASENGNGALAVLATEHTRKRFNPGIFGGGLGFWTEVYYKYRLVNLVTGKMIISSKENHFKHTIETVGDYFLANSDLYRFLDNGDVEHTVKNDQELAVRILKRYFEERGINAGVKTVAWEVQIDYNLYIAQKYANPDLSGAFSALAPQFAVPFEKSEPLYRDPKKYLNTPLEIHERKYTLYFRDKTTNGIM